jgi:chitinase
VTRKNVTLTPIASTFSYSNGTISIVNASGSAQDLSQVELTFDDADAIASVWGTPWMAWQIARNGAHYTLTGGTASANWPKGGSMTVVFTPPWQSTNAPSNLHLYAIEPPALVRCSVNASESGGTITVANTSGAAIPLRSAELDFTYSGTVGNVWGTPWMAWAASHSGQAFVLKGGTKDGTMLAAAGSLTASFAPANGAHASAIVFKAACGTGPTPSPAPSPTPTPSPTPKPTATPTAGPTVPPGSIQFVGFWESWSDTNGADAYNTLGSVPAGVTTIDVAFSVANDNTIAPVQNYYPLLPGAQAIHARGGKVLLSFGGATSQFQITNVAQFVANLKAFQSANPGLYDGFDFDDEVLPWNGQQQLISVINAVRAAFPHAILSVDAFMSGADPQVALSTHQGEDIAIMQQAGGAIDYVNVMDYDQYDWHPTAHPSCTYVTGAADDCRLDVLRDFANVHVPGGATFPASKIVMGLMIGSADDGSVITPANAQSDATWIRSHGYGGIMIWDVDRDNPQAFPGGTGHPKGTYVTAISAALGT